MTEPSLSQRKSEHLRLVAEGAVTHNGSTLLEKVELIHQALPELDYDDVRLETSFFGRQAEAPLMITSMTGGSRQAGDLNRSLARVAHECGIPFSVGSQRIMLRHPETTPDFAVRDLLPDSVFLGNIGAVQLLEYSTEQVAGLVEAIDADGICVHLNVAQELMQSDGNRQFKGLLEAIARLHERLDGKLLVKETGAGMSVETLKRLKSIGVSVVDVAGAGGTSWTKVEGLREVNGELRSRAELFGDWGIPTAVSVVAARRVMGFDGSIVASGGIRSGLDVARTLALGADMAGVAREVLLALLDGKEEAAIAYIKSLVQDLRTAMLLCGAGDIAAMKHVPCVVTGDLRVWLQALGVSVEKDIERESGE